jgi:hypothetical protein
MPECKSDGQRSGSAGTVVRDEAQSDDETRVIEFAKTATLLINCKFRVDNNQKTCQEEIQGGINRRTPTKTVAMQSLAGREHEGRGASTSPGQIEG